MAELYVRNKMQGILQLTTCRKTKPHERNMKKYNKYNRKETNATDTKTQPTYRD